MKKRHILRLSILLLFISSISFAQTAAQVWAQNGAVKATANDREGAIVDFTKSIELDQNSDVYYRRAIAYMQTRQYEKSLADFNKAETLKKKDADFFSLRGKCKVALKDDKNAIIDFDKAIQLNPKYGEAYFFRALSKITLKDKDGACKDLHAAIDLKYDKALSTLQSNCN